MEIASTVLNVGVIGGKRVVLRARKSFTRHCYTNMRGDQSARKCKGYVVLTIDGPELLNKSGIIYFQLAIMDSDTPLQRPHTRFRCYNPDVCKIIEVGELEGGSIIYWSVTVCHIKCGSGVIECIVWIPLLKHK